MKHFFQTNKTRLLLLSGALFVVCSTTPVGAQSQNEMTQVLNRINQLENQVQTMSRAVYRGDRNAIPESMPAIGGDSSSVASFEVRIGQVEEQQRTLTGQIEKISYDLQQIKAHVERLQADTDQRFQQGSGTAQPSSGSQPTALAPPANQLGTLSSLSEGNNGPAEALYEQAFTNIRDGKYDQAEEGFKQFTSQYPGHPLAANAQYWLGETYYVRGDFKQAAKMFAQGYQNFPKGAKAEDSLLKLGLSLSKLGKKDDACLSLKQLQKEVSDEANPLRRKATSEIKQLGCQ
ncbi:MAG: tol-pal system protein YbgF [Proteobacteria bacterium]|nr:tol-pal system protein YbgF [Pseudomonadota bacterium]